MRSKESKYGMKWHLAMITTAVLCSCFAPAQPSDSALQRGLHLLEEGRTTLEEKPLLGSLALFTELSQEDRTNATYPFQLARVNGYLLDVYAARGDKKLAAGALDNAIALAHKSILLDDKLAAAHALLADFYGRKIQQGGFMAGPRFGPKIDAENKQALALAPQDSRVHASLGRQYLFAPKMFGGDISKAVENFRRATELDPTSDETYVWLAIALRKAGDPAAAAKALSQALKLNPRSAFAKRTQENQKP
jgi:tetratricopeptide (TPR) repeat protein